MKKLLASALLVFGLTIIQGFSTVMAQEPPPGHPPMPPRSVSVTGDAQQDVAPDTAVLALTLYTRDKVLDEAKKTNDQQVEKLMKVVGEFKIAKEKVTTSNVFITPEYNYNKQNKQTLEGYTVNRSIRVELVDLSVQERFLSALVSANIDQVNGVEFKLAEPEKYAAELRKKAFEDAKAKANAMAEAAGMKLGSALTIRVGESAEIMPVPRPMMAMARAGGMEMAADSVAPSVPGSVTMRETVGVVFAMEPK